MDRRREAWVAGRRKVHRGRKKKLQAWQLRMGFRLACILAHDAFPFHACLLVFH